MRVYDARMLLHMCERVHILDEVPRESKLPIVHSRVYISPHQDTKILTELSWTQS